MSVRQFPIRLDKVRSFGAVFSDTRRFLRENFATYFLSLLLLAGPFVLVTCTMESYYQINLFSGDDIFPSFDRFGSWIAINALVGQFRWLINGLIIALVVSHIIKQYQVKGPGKFDTHDVSVSIVKSFASNGITWLFLLVLCTIIGVAIAGFIYAISRESILMGITLIGLIGLGYILVRFPFWYIIFSTFNARAENGGKNPMKHFGYAAGLISGSWWQTWAVFFIMWLLLYALGKVISIPAEIMTYVAKMYSLDMYASKTDWKLIETILTSVAEFAKTMVNSIFCLAVGLHFFSLREKQEGRGTKELIEKIGTKADDDGVELTY